MCEMNKDCNLVARRRKETQATVLHADAELSLSFFAQVTYVQVGNKSPCQ